MAEALSKAVAPSGNVVVLVVSETALTVPFAFRITAVPLGRMPEATNSLPLTALAPSAPSAPSAPAGPVAPVAPSAPAVPCGPASPTILVPATP